VRQGRRFSNGSIGSTQAENRVCVPIVCQKRGAAQAVWHCHWAWTVSRLSRIHFEDLVKELWSWLTPRHYSTDEALAGPGVPGEGLQLLLSGRASAYDGAGARLYRFSPGDAIWPPYAYKGSLSTTRVPSWERNR